MVLPYVILALSWLIWCTLHSALISLTVTETLRRRFPDSFRYYRLFYNLIAVVTLIPVIGYAFSIKTEPIVTWSGPWLPVPVVLTAAALYFFWAGARRYDFKQFIGLRQVKDERACSVLTDDCRLDTDGVLSVVRHPWYAGGMLIVWARPLDISAMVTNIVLCVYFVVGAILEERKLKVQFAAQYAAYQKRVSMLFPLKWAAKRLSGKN